MANAVTVTITTIPDPGSTAADDVEYSLAGAAAVSSGVKAPGTFEIDEAVGLEIRIRLVNLGGKVGPWSAVKIAAGDDLAFIFDSTLVTFDSTTSTFDETGV